MPLKQNVTSLMRRAQWEQWDADLDAAEVADVDSDAAEVVDTDKAEVADVDERTRGSIVSYSHIASEIPAFSDGKGHEIVIEKNHMTSDNSGICENKWLGLMLSDQIWVSQIT